MVGTKSSLVFVSLYQATRQLAAGNPSKHEYELNRKPRCSPPLPAAFTSKVAVIQWTPLISHSLLVMASSTRAFEGDKRLVVHPQRYGDKAWCLLPCRDQIPSAHRTLPPTHQRSKIANVGSRQTISCCCQNKPESALPRLPCLRLNCFSLLC